MVRGGRFGRVFGDGHNKHGLFLKEGDRPWEGVKRTGYYEAGYVCETDPH